MTKLFPALRKKMFIACAVCVVFAIAYLCITPGANPLFPLMLALLMPALLVITYSLNATNAHNRLLLVLYDELNPESFIETYAPKLALCGNNPNLKLMVCLHLSNAYCALGEFKKAEETLAVAPLQQKKEEDTLISTFAVTSNYCYCAQQQGDTAAARKYFDQLPVLKQKLEVLQKSKPEKKRMVFSIKLNELCMDMLETGKGNVGALKELVKHNHQRLHKVSISLWVARAQLNHNNRREAQELLEKIVTLAPHLYCGKEAAKLLAALPEKAK